MCDKLYIFWIHVSIWLIWAHFHQNQTILKIWPLYKRSMTFSYFVLYLDNATSYGYHVIDFFTPYNKRNNMTCITTRLKHFEFSSAWGGSQCPQGVSVYFSYGIPETVELVHHGESFYIGEIKITSEPCHVLPAPGVKKYRVPKIERPIAHRTLC